MFSIIDKIIAHTSSMATKTTLSFTKETISGKKQHKEDLFTSFFFFFGIKCATCGAAFVRQLRKTLSTVLTKLLLFAHLKIIVFSFVKVGNAPLFSIFFPHSVFFCIKTSKAGKARKRKASRKRSIEFRAITKQNKICVMKRRDVTWLQLFK